jgi:HD-GYP domain-containing protein (c-di-GMP phosphodiesterase class II)
VHGIYGKGSGSAGGTRQPVARLAPYATVMEVCDPALGAHAARVAANAEVVAIRMGWEGERLDALRLGAALHDVGKVNLRPEVLRKPGRLDEDELAEIRAHPVEGMWLIAGVPTLAPALPYVLFHHERWDGLGYPTRRSGAAIPLEGRILAVADAFDAMTSGRPYRPSLAPAEAAGEIERCAGTQFDPEVADAFLAALDAGEIVWSSAAAAA